MDPRETVRKLLDLEEVLLWVHENDRPFNKQYWAELDDWLDANSVKDAKQRRRPECGMSACIGGYATWCNPELELYWVGAGAHLAKQAHNRDGPDRVADVADSFCIRNTRTGSDSVDAFADAFDLPRAVAECLTCDNMDQTAKEAAADVRGLARRFCANHEIDFESMREQRQPLGVSIPA